MKLVLHNYWRSSASYRVRIGLGLKELAYDYVAVDIVDNAQQSETYRAMNAMAQVPTLELTGDDGRTATLIQSLPILEYLEERWPEVPLLPDEPILRARTRALAEIINAGIQPLQNLTVMRKLKQAGIDEVAWVRAFIESGLTAYAREVEATAGRFSVGDVPTLADVCLIPQLFAARRFQVELGSTFDRLLAIEARCQALPGFANAAPDRQPDAKR
ncbi:MAG TPA: maleylacetoacetate isomerase [Kofleriaceae bacterium]